MLSEMIFSSAALIKSRAESAVNERKKFLKLLWEQEDLSSNCLSLYMTSAMFYNILLCSSARLKDRIHSLEQVSQHVLRKSCKERLVGPLMCEKI